MHTLKISKRYYKIQIGFLVLGLVCWVVGACSGPSFPSFPSLQEVSSFSPSELDSLSTVLEKEIDPGWLPDSLEAYYGLLLTDVHQRQGRSLINDTLIYKSVDYYRTHNPIHLGKAYQLAIAQMKWQNPEPAEMDTLLERAIRELQQRGDSLLPSVLLERMLMNYERKNYEKTEEYGRYLLRAYPVSRAVLTYILGLNYHQAGKTDSCFYTLGNALEMAYEDKDTFHIQHISRIYATLLAGEKEDGKAALSVLKKAEAAFPDSDYPYDSPYALAWYALGNLDSMQYYLSRIQDTDATNTAFRMMYQTVLNAKRGWPIASSFFSLQDSLLLSMAQTQRTEKERWFKQNELEYKTVALKNKNLSLQRNLLWIAIGILCGILFMVWRYQRLLLRKERIIYEKKELIRSYVEQLRENEFLLDQHEATLHTLSDQIDEKKFIEHERERLIKENASLQTQIDQYVQTLQTADQSKRFLADLLIAQSPVLKSLSKEAKYIEEARWPAIVGEVDRFHNRYTQRLRLDYPALTEQDLRVCCLILLRFSTSSLALFLGISSASVTKRKQRIKERMAQSKPDLWSYEKSLETYLRHY